MKPGGPNIDNKQPTVKPVQPGEKLADDEPKPKEPSKEIPAKDPGEEIADEESKRKELNSGGKMRRLLGG